MSPVLSESPPPVVSWSNSLADAPFQSQATYDYASLLQQDQRLDHFRTPPLTGAFCHIAKRAAR